eukprot:GDKJ01042931.1.p1 GENE.GDKJ01042931.1~~GDKJ01042931.1.p1  ORF type:complete len:339 (-),score=87.33 GDKJ01042931.1:79-1095(-)
MKRAAEQSANNSLPQKVPVIQQQNGNNSSSSTPQESKPNNDESAPLPLPSLPVASPSTSSIESPWENLPLPNFDMKDVLDAFATSASSVSKFLYPPSLDEEERHDQEQEDDAEDTDFFRSSNEEKTSKSESDSVQIRQLQQTLPSNAISPVLDHIIIFDPLRGFINPAGLAACFKSPSLGVNLDPELAAKYRKQLIRAVLETETPLRFVRGGVSHSEITEKRVGDNEALKVLNVGKVLNRKWLPEDELLRRDSGSTGGSFSNPIWIIVVTLSCTILLMQCCCCLIEKDPTSYDLSLLQGREDWMFEIQENGTGRIRRNRRTASTNSSTGSRRSSLPVR